MEPTPRPSINFKHLKSVMLRAHSLSVDAYRDSPVSSAALMKRLAVALDDMQQLGQVQKAGKDVKVAVKAFHEDLVKVLKAAKELYHTNPNDGLKNLVVCLEDAEKTVTVSTARPVQPSTRVDSWAVRKTKAADGWEVVHRSR